ncbi:MAG: hypothetical protein D6753_01500 [Planctomycetota bacterium]|nr:MAG: hypothetical protein D6753_01500 [Planctomycetota bacterium]
MSDSSELREATDAFCESLHHADPVQDQAIAGFGRIRSIRILARALKICAILVAALAMLVGAGAWYLYRQVRTYTSVEPRQLPIAMIPDERLVELEQQVQQIEQPAAPDSPPPEPIELTSELINGLIARSERFRGRVYVEISDGVLYVDVSLPTEIPGAKGRYFNGRVALTFSWADDHLDWKILGVESDGRPLPFGWLEELLQKKADDLLAADPRIETWLHNFEAVEIRADRVVLVPKNPQPEESEPSKAPVDSEEQDPRAGKQPQGG